MSRKTSATAPLCLACSSSLPPRLWKRTQEDAQRGSTSAGGGGGESARRPSSELFLTRCCGRPICPSCLTSNPRLARYDPCLACLGGVGAVDSAEKARGQHIVVSNIDGAVRDEDVFVVGDEDEDEDSEMHDMAVAKAPSTIPPLSAVAKPPERNASTGTNTGVRPDPNKSEELPDCDHGSPGRYYIQPEDTLLGISLRLGVDGRALCKLNDLPPSTLRTTPHLLHTRTFLVLPQSRSQQYATGDASPEEETRRRREHAQVAFQHVTKETDHGIAQAYVALAEDSESEPDVTCLKAEGEKEPQREARGKTTLEERAVDRYLDDDEWERRERAEGRGVHIQRLAIGGPRTGVGEKRAEKSGWWRWLR